MREVRRVLGIEKFPGRVEYTNVICSQQWHLPGDLASLEGHCGYLGYTQELGVGSLYVLTEVVEDATEFGSDDESQVQSRGAV